AKQPGRLTPTPMVLRHRWVRPPRQLQLRRRGIDTIVLCGISTNIGVESTARNAWELGFNLVIAEDACSAASAEQHNNSINHIYPRIARVRSVEEILHAL
ncbi:isochorismatase family protein, partial [Escherichia coli]